MLGQYEGSIVGQNDVGRVDGTHEEMYEGIGDGM